jgi:hypothetical protein
MATKNTPNPSAARSASPAPGATRRRDDAHRPDREASVQRRERHHLRHARAGRRQHGDGRRHGLAGEREQRKHEAEALREREDGEHGQAPRDQTGQEVRASPRHARAEREPESDRALGA